MSIAPRSSASQSKIRLKWQDGRLCEPSEQEQDIYDLLGLGLDPQERKPLVLFLTSAQEKDASLLKKINTVVFKDERVQIGARLFTLVKLPRARADERIEKLIGRIKGPTLATFSRKGRRVGVLANKASASKLFGMMKKAAQKDYRAPLTTLVKKMQKLLTSLDKLVATRNNLQKRTTKSKSKSTKVERKLTELQKAIQAIDEAESKIWKKYLERDHA